MLNSMLSMLPRFGLGLILCSLASCATVIPVSDGCRIFGPIYSSPQDTAPTLSQIDAHNAAWEAACLPADQRVK